MGSYLPADRATVPFLEQIVSKTTAHFLNVAFIINSYMLIYIKTTCIMSLQII